MNHSLYLDCSSGISGDMTVAALLDLGADEQILREALASLPLDGFRIEISRVLKSSIDTCDFNVILDQDNHDHDMAYLHGDHGHEHPHCHEHSHEHTHGREHTHEHAHSHGHPHDHIHCHEHTQEHTHSHEHSHDHVHRGLQDVYDILEAASLTERALTLAKKIFHIVAEAESKAHNQPIDQVHFHEVGAVDSIVDIAAIAVCVDNLGIDRVYVPSVSEGYGQVRCQHGLLPIPVPAVAAIAASYRLPLHISNVQGELVTPTGAAVLAALMTDKKLPKHFEIRRTGLGAGKRQYANAGFLRAMLIQEDISLEHASLSDSTPGSILKLEANLDDCTGETLGFVMDALLGEGALDAYYTPIYMKKNRPGYLLSVLCRPEARENLENLIFCHTTTIGIRRIPMERSVLPRLLRTISTPYGDARIKYVLHDSEVYAYPEYDSTAYLAGETGRSLEEMYHLLKAEAIQKNPDISDF